MGENDRRAVVIATHPELFETLIGEAGYEIVGMADIAVNGERLAAHHCPDVIVIENELTGIQGWEALAGLKAASPGSQILMVHAEGWRPSDISSIDAFAVVTRSHLEYLVSELTDLDTWIAERTNAGMQAQERRRADRRHHQDWSLVGFEKRGDADRRVGAT